MLIKDSGSFNFKKVNFLFIKEALLSESFWNTILLVLLLFFIFLFSKIFERNLNLSSRAYCQLLKNLTPKNIYDAFGIDEKNDIGANRAFFNLNKTKIKEFFSWIFRSVLFIVSFSWLLVFFTRLQKLIQHLIKQASFSTFKNSEERDYLLLSFKFYG